MNIRKQALAMRIVNAFVLMTFLVSGLFSWGVVEITHRIEERLVSHHLDGDLKRMLDVRLPNGMAPDLEPDTQFFSSRPEGPAIPHVYDGLADGFSEISRQGQAFYAYKRNINGIDYLLLQDQQDFETREQALYDVVFAGFILSVLAAWGLGILLARRVMEPVIRLAQQVSHHDQLIATAPALAADYPNDEVGQLASAFDGTLNELRSSLERERLFTSDVSHELRTPLMVIAATTELLQAESAGGSQAYEKLQRIRRASEEMGDLVQTFLLLARGSAHNAQANTVSLEQVACEQYQLWHTEATRKGLILTLSIEAEDKQRYHQSLLRTVISNLLRNALHYTDDGYIKLVLEDGGLRVEDSGIGIPEPQHQQIFEPFVRGTQGRGEGLGLGLSLVKRICAHQGWTICLHNARPRGCIFEVRLRA